MTLNLPIPQLPKGTNKNDFDEDEDSENDPDYVPDDARQKPQGESDSSDSSESESGMARKSKKKRKFDTTMAATTTKSQPSEEEERAQKEKTRQQLWESFQASLASPNPLSTQQKQSLPRLVKVVKKYRFAGEDVIKVEDVPENSPEATKWPRWDPSTSQYTVNETSTPGTVDTPSPLESTSSHVEDNVGSKASDVPPPRTTKKTRKSLDAMFASATASATASAMSKFNATTDESAILSKLLRVKGQKLTTLDKSAMDWREHVQSVDDVSKDEIEKNRRSGGSYLSKVEFLQRVEERMENAAEEGRSKRKRT
ncbi:hypothetical protein Clacol_004875 [Clathrus columnatus]|uniref:SWR1-complex protein 5 n=1 Tax=Clathrus columnatus TaxID=1419009 RepID=A0AAV5ADC4_9AGAM|nr:hypothetical protein Clacol_004875 [Clathrus columnatus]